MGVMFGEDSTKSSGISLYLEEHQVLVYVETNRENLVGIDLNGGIRWTVAPAKHPSFSVYRKESPSIVDIKKLDIDDRSKLEKLYPNRSFEIYIAFDSSQFGAIDIRSGAYIEIGNN